MEQREYPQIGNRVWATFRNIKGHCSMGYKVGDEFEISGHDTAGLCGFLYHDLFPYIVMLQFGGGFPPGWGDPDSVQIECMDRGTVTVELRRERRQEA